MNKIYDTNVESCEELIIEHQKMRFFELCEILRKNPKTRIIIPPLVNTHGNIIDYDRCEILCNGKIMVPPIIRNNDGIIIDKKNNVITEDAYNQILTSIETGTAGYNSNSKKYQNIQNLVKKLLSHFPYQVKYGYIGEKNASEDYKVDDNDAISSSVIHIFGANENNWNVSPNQFILGGGQAGCFKSQRPRVFGIVTLTFNKNLEYLRQNLFEKSKTIY